MLLSASTYCYLRRQIEFAGVVNAIYSFWFGTTGKCCLAQARTKEMGALAVCLPNQRTPRCKIANVPNESFC